MGLVRYKIGTLDDLEEGAARLFAFEHDGESVEAFLVNFEGDLFAYRNKCVHTPMRLDGTEEGVFFSGGRSLRCQSHGALFRPDTGECISGPAGCPGKHLQFLTLAADGDDLYVVMHSAANDPSDPPVRDGGKDPSVR